VLVAGRKDVFVSDHCREPSRGRVSKDKGKRTLKRIRAVGGVSGRIKAKR
jgi:hypothetical protein